MRQRFLESLRPKKNVDDADETRDEEDRKEIDLFLILLIRTWRRRFRNSLQESLVHQEVIAYFRNGYAAWLNEAGSNGSFGFNLPGWLTLGCTAKFSGSFAGSMAGIVAAVS